MAHLMQPNKSSLSKPPGFRGSENQTLAPGAGQKRQERVEWEAKQRERETAAAKFRESKRIEVEVSLSPSASLNSLPMRYVDSRRRGMR